MLTGPPPKFHGTWDILEALMAARLVSRDPPLRRGDGEEAPFAGHALELVSAALLEFES
jgi:hypothetical protein